jgi:phosphate transport system substrate-binding protein
VSGASRPIKTSEAALCANHGVEFVELPIAYDGLAVVVNPKNTWASSITTAELKAMWEPAARGKVTRWSDVREGWPAHELHLHGAGTDSGTYDYFTHAIVGQEHQSRSDFRSSEDDNDLVRWIAEDEHALGFFGLAYYERDTSRLKLLAADDERPDNGAGPILPTPESVSDGTYQPLARPLFVYVSTTALARPEVASFVGFYLERAAELVAQVHYIPLPAAAYTLARQRLESRRTGSLFGAHGSEVGISIEALLQREQSSVR